MKSCRANTFFVVVKDQNATEFANLVEGIMLITEYETKLDEVSKYAPNLIATKRDKGQKVQ